MCRTQLRIQDLLHRLLQVQIIFKQADDTGLPMGDMVTMGDIMVIAIILLGIMAQDIAIVTMILTILDIIGEIYT